MVVSALVCDCFVLVWMLVFGWCLYLLVSCLRCFGFSFEALLIVLVCVFLCLLCVLIFGFQALCWCLICVSVLSVWFEFASCWFGLLLLFWFRWFGLVLVDFAVCVSF